MDPSAPPPLPLVVLIGGFLAPCDGSPEADEEYWGKDMLDRRDVRVVVVHPRYVRLHRMTKRAQF